MFGGNFNNTHFYDVLGVDKNATEAEIKRAYRKLAQKHHPDQSTGNAEKFKEINKAYKTLSDKEARAKYDSGGESALGSDFFSGGDLFSTVFKMFTSDGGGFSHESSSRRTEDVRYKLSLSLEELFTGCEKRFRINRKILCISCDGTGSKSRSESTCSSCNGRGQKASVKQLGNTLVRSIEPCELCKGSGQFVKKGDRCTKCKKGKIEYPEELSVIITPGTEDEKEIVLERKADEERGKVTGDFIVIVNEKKHNLYTRFGNNLIIYKNISLKEALHGYLMKLDDISGEKIKIGFGKMVIKPGDVRRILRLGMPIKGNKEKRGDLFIRFDIDFPSWEEINKGDMVINKEAFEKKKNTFLAENDIYDEESLKQYILNSRQKKRKRSSGFESVFKFSSFFN